MEKQLSVYEDMNLFSTFEHILSTSAIYFEVDKVYATVCQYGFQKLSQWVSLDR